LKPPLLAVLPLLLRMLDSGCDCCCQCCCLQAHSEVSACHLLMSAAQVALTRKNLVEQLTALSAGPPAFDASSVKKGRYLGQFERKQPEGPTHSWWV
jgi:hypothetical protein